VGRALRALSDLVTTYGSGIGDVGDLDPSFAIVDERRNFALEQVRRLSTPRDSLPWAPGEGLDLRLLLNQNLDGAALNAVRGEIVHELLKDDRIRAANVDLAFDEPSSALRISIACDGAAGPFRFVIAASALDVSLLSLG
jgi:hypothetical protein